MSSMYSKLIAFFLKDKFIEVVGKTNILKCEESIPIIHDKGCFHAHLMVLVKPHLNTKVI